MCLNVNIKGNKSDIINNTKKDVEILSADEINKIKEYIKGTDYELIFLLDLATGLRIGELLALDWQHIDLEKQELFVERSVKEVYIYDNDKVRHIETIFQTPKTLNSSRTVTIPTSIVNILNQIENKKGLLFKDELGSPLKAKNVSTKWSNILQSV